MLAELPRGRSQTVNTDREVQAPGIIPHHQNKGAFCRPGKEVAHMPGCKGDRSCLEFLELDHLGFWSWRDHSLPAFRNSDGLLLMGELKSPMLWRCGESGKSTGMLDVFSRQTASTNAGCYSSPYNNVKGSVPSMVSKQPSSGLQGPVQKPMASHNGFLRLSQKLKPLSLPIAVYQTPCVGP